LGEGGRVQAFEDVVALVPGRPVSALVLVCVRHRVCGTWVRIVLEQRWMGSWSISAIVALLVVPFCHFGCPGSWLSAIFWLGTSFDAAGSLPECSNGAGLGE
jgi:hypothetical protein